MNIAIIGCGAVVKRYHIAGVSGSPFKIAAIVDKDRKALDEVGDEFNIPYRYLEIGEILKNKDIQAVSICTPTETHYEMVIRCLDAGKNVLVEKPLAFNYVQARELTRTAAQSGLTCGVIQNWRMFPAVQEARNKIQQGRIGALHSAHIVAAARFPNSWTRSMWLFNKKGVLYDFAPHAVDMFFHLTGLEPKSVYANCRDFTGQMGFVNYAKIFVKHEIDVLVSYDISWLSGSVVLQLYLNGTAGHLILDVRNNLLFELHGTLTPFDLMHYYLKSGAILIRDVLSKKYILGPQRFFAAFYNDFYSAILNKTMPLVNFIEASKTNLILDAAYISSRLNNEIQVSDMLRGNYDDLLESI